MTGSNVFWEFAATLFVAFLASAVVYLIASRFSIRHTLSGRNARILVFVCFVFYLVEFITLAILRHVSVHSDVDTAIFNQIIWKSLSGELLESGTNLVFTKGNALGLHFSPLLLALVPVYSIWSDVRTLLIAQTLILAATVFPIFWYARGQLGYLLGFAISFAFLLSPSLQYVNLADFHEIAIATLLLAFACFFLLRRRYIPFGVCLSAALMVKEEIALPTIALGIFIFFVQRARWFGLFLAGFGIIWLVVVLTFIIPYFRGADYPIAQYHFSSFGTGFSGILIGIVTQPAKFLELVVTPAKIEFILHLLVPLALTPLVGMEVVLLALPTLVGLLLTGTEAPTSIRFQYTAPLLPFFFFAAIVGLRRLLDRKVAIGDQVHAWRLALSMLIIVASLASFYFQAPGILARDYNLSQYVTSERDQIGKALARLVPRDRVAVVQYEWLPQLSGRDELYDIVTIDDYRRADYLFADKARPWYGLRKENWDWWLDTGYFEILSDANDFILAKRKDPENRLSVRFGDSLTLMGYTLVPPGVPRGGSILRPNVAWRAESPILQRYRFQVQVVDEQGHVWATEDREPDDGFSPTTRWIPGRMVGDQYSLRLPPTMPAGDYQLTMAVHDIDGDANLKVLDRNGKDLGTELVFAPVRIEKDKSSYTVNDLIKEMPLTPLFADMEDIRFLGYFPFRQSIRPGELLDVGLYWRARAKPRGDYVVAVQLRDLNNHVAFEQAARPANNTYPTLQWDPGEVLLDWHDFNLPTSVAPGTYQVFVVLRDAATQRELGQIQVSDLSVIP